MKSGFPDSESHCFPLHWAAFTDILMHLLTPLLGFMGLQISASPGYIKELIFFTWRALLAQAEVFLHPGFPGHQDNWNYLNFLPFLTFTFYILTPQKARPVGRIPPSSLGEHVSGWKGGFEAKFSRSSPAWLVFHHLPPWGFVSEAECGDGGGLGVNSSTPISAAGPLGAL